MRKQGITRAGPVKGASPANLAGAPRIKQAMRLQDYDLKCLLAHTYQDIFEHGDFFSRFSLPFTRKRRFLWT